MLSFAPMFVYPRKKSTVATASPTPLSNSSKNKGKNSKGKKILLSVFWCVKSQTTAIAIFPSILMSAIENSN